MISDHPYTLRNTTFDWRRSNGEWQTQRRQIFDRGNGVALLPYNRAQGTIILIRQFRYPTYVNGNDALLVDGYSGQIMQVVRDLFW